MKCKKCNTPNEETAKFCYKCGEPLEKEQVHPINKNRKMYIIIGCLLVAIALALATLIAFNKNSEKEYYTDFMTLGNKYYEALDYEKAEIAYLEAIAIDPKQEEPYLYLSAIYVAQEEYEKASAILEQAIEATGNESIEEEIEKIKKLENEKVENEDLETETPETTDNISEGSYSIRNESEYYEFTALRGEEDILCCELYYKDPQTGEYEHLSFEWLDGETPIEIATYDEKEYSFFVTFENEDVIIQNISGLPKEQVVLSKDNRYGVANITVAVKNYFSQYAGNKIEKSDSYVFSTDGIFSSGGEGNESVVISENGKEKYIVLVSTFEADIVGAASVYDYQEWSDSIHNGYTPIESLEEFSIYDYYDFDV